MQTVSAIKFDPMERLTLVVKYPAGFRLRMAVAVALARMAAFVGGMGFRGEVETGVSRDGGTRA